MKTTEQTIDEARDIFACDDISIDDNAQVIETDSGHWVQAWVYIPKENDDEDQNI